MITADSKYKLGNIEHTFPPLTLKGKFTYTTRIMSLHKELLTMLDDFDTLCELQDIPYWINGQTLLGAIRHQGFIPWVEEAELIIMEDNLEKVKAMYLQSTQWQLQSNGNHYYITAHDQSAPHIQLSVLNFDENVEGGKYITQSQAISHDELHPRQRYLFEDIMLWGAQQGQPICQRLFGSSCFLTATIPKQSLKQKLQSFIRDFKS